MQGTIYIKKTPRERDNLCRSGPADWLDCPVSLAAAFIPSLFWEYCSPLSPSSSVSPTPSSSISSSSSLGIKGWWHVWALLRRWLWAVSRWVSWIIFVTGCRGPADYLIERVLLDWWVFMIDVFPCWWWGRLFVVPLPVILIMPSCPCFLFFTKDSLFKWFMTLI